MISSYQATAKLLKLLSHPARVAILTVLREGEQCVCHIEAMLNLRQATISQHLKLFKDAGIVSDRRDGWNIFYRVIDPRIYDIIDTLFAFTGQPSEIQHNHASANCTCPKCDSEQASFSPGASRQHKNLRLRTYSTENEITLPKSYSININSKKGLF